MATQRPDPVQSGLLDDIEDGGAAGAGAGDELPLQATANTAIAPDSARTKLPIGASVPKPETGAPVTSGRVRRRPR
jgi:hypothetical protein